MSAKPTKTQKDQIMEAFIGNLLLDRAALVNRLKQQNEIDLDEECGYPKVLTSRDYLEMIEREGIAKRYACLYPEECWSVDPDIFETWGEEDTSAEKKLNKLFRKTKAFHYLHRVDEVSGYASYGLLYMAFNDGRMPDQPVRGIQEGPPVRGRPPAAAGEPVDLMFLRVFDQTRCKIIEKEKNPKSPRHGEPTMYEIDFADPTGVEDGVTTTDKMKVHWSRVIHVADNRVSSELFGEPRLKPVFNRLKDLKKLLGGSAEMFYKGAFPGIALETPDGLADDVDLKIDDIKAEMREYYMKLKRFIALRNLKVKSLAPNVAPPQEHILGQFQALAVAAGCPLQILMGMQEGRLQSNQDSRNWNKKLRMRQRQYLTPMLLQPFIDRLVLLGVIDDIEWIIDWPDLNAPTQEDRADIAVKLCNALFKYTASSAGKFVIGPKALLTMILGLSPAQVKIAMSDLNAAMAGAVPAAGPLAAGARGKLRPSTQSRDPTMSAATGQSKA